LIKIIPLREAQEYTVRLKEKQDEARQASEYTIDFTRYDLTVNGRTYHNLWKRNLVWRVIASALEAGLSLDVLNSIVPSTKFVVVEGELRGEEFLAAAQKSKIDAGYVFRPKRLFADDDHLIHVAGKTIAVSNQWGLPSLLLIDKIIQAVPSAEMSYKSVDHEPK